MFLMVALLSCGSGEAQKSVSLGPQEFEKQLAAEGERILLDVRTLHLRQAGQLSFRAVRQEQAQRSLIRQARRAAIRG